jgi:hypothetical protein
MPLEEIDYTKFTLAELLDAREHIDDRRYPERAKQLDLLIKDRRVRSAVPPVAAVSPIPRVAIADEQGNIAAVKGGRMPSLGAGLSQIVGGILFGIVWISVAESNPKTPHAFVWIGYFTILSSVIAGCYHLYNAFARNRFSQHDLVAPNKEPDPMDRALFGDAPPPTRAVGERPMRQFPGKFCPFCAAAVEATHDFCPSCGKDI